MSVMDVYNFKAAVEPAVQLALDAQALNALTSQDPQTFQKARARVELLFVLGAGKSSHLAMTEDTGLEMEVEDAWAASLQLSLLTEASAVVQGKYEAQVRYVMARLPALINNTPGGLVNHVIYGPMKHQGSTAMFSPEKGFYRTDMHYGFDISIQLAAWAKLLLP